MDAAGEGCFNWASYDDDPLFDTRRGTQLSTVVNLVNGLGDAWQRSRSLEDVAAALGLSRDEVDLIVAQWTDV